MWVGSFVASKQSGMLQSSSNWLTISLVITTIIIGRAEASSNSSSVYSLFHRLVPSNQTSSPPSSSFPWQKRAVLIFEIDELIQSNISTQSFETFKVSSFIPEKSSKSIKIPWESSIDSLDYQLNLIPERYQEPPPESYPELIGSSMISVPLCISKIENLINLKEYLNIWISSSQKNKNNHENSNQIELIGIQWGFLFDSICFKTFDRNNLQVWNEKNFNRVQDFFEDFNRFKTRIIVRSPELLPEPVLRPFPIHATPEFLPDGTLKPIPQEKGWLAKYWMYILPVVVFLVMGGGAPPEEEAQASGGSGEK